jgi:hypothetical protein
MVLCPTTTPRMMPKLNATPTAAGPAKRPWICSIAVKMAENPCRARAGAMIRIRSAVWSARTGSRRKRAAAPSGQSAIVVQSITRAIPTHTARALTRRHALWAPSSAFSRWKVGMMRVTSV